DLRVDRRRDAVEVEACERTFDALDQAGRLEQREQLAQARVGALIELAEAKTELAAALAGVVRPHDLAIDVDRRAFGRALESAAQAIADLGQIVGAERDAAS